MTKAPHSIGLEQPLSRAHAMMREHHIRHLPVLHGGHLVGIITERDVGLVESLKDVDPKTVSVEEGMTSVVYAVAPTTPLADAVRAMLDHKYGAAVVMEREKVVGIFTTVDLCRALLGFLDANAA